MTPELLTVKLDKFTYGGDALGRLIESPTGKAGPVIFVPFALPGETVSVRVIDEKRSHVLAELLEVLEPSPERIVPRCRHFGICGGCHYQHFAYQNQLEVKTGILHDQLGRIGKIENPPIRSIVPSPEAWNYRNHIQLHLTTTGKTGYIDVQGRKVIPIIECFLPEHHLDELWHRLEFDPGLNLDRISLRLGVDGESMLVLQSDNPEPPELELETALSVVHVTRGDTVVMAGNDHLRMAVAGRQFRVTAESFFQVNSQMAAKMVEHLLAYLPVTHNTTLLDVYCGVGLFSAFFAAQVGRVVGVETSPSACKDYETNLDEFDNVELFQAPAEQVLPSINLKPDCAIVDPPRTGLDERVLDALVALAPERIAYVSCDPSTLGRDAARLISSGYNLLQVTPFDLFPQTFHIESISIFQKG